MSSTNKTTNYELSQYIGSDKPTYLGDYNGDMQKIDTQMKANADGVSTATSTANTASTNASTALTKANEAKTTAENAETTANSASSTASTANINAQTALNTSSQNSQLIQAIQTYLNMTIFNSYSITNVNGKVNTASNQDGSLGKVYGHFQYEASGLWQQVYTIYNTSLRPNEEIVIEEAGIVSNNVNGITGRVTLTIYPNGNISIKCAHNTNITATYYANFFPCLYFMKNFGDTPEE